MKLSVKKNVFIELYIFGKDCYNGKKRFMKLSGKEHCMKLSNKKRFKKLYQVDKN